MRIRDALESDAEALASVTGRPREVVRNMIHDRSVRVAVEEEGDRNGTEDEGVGDDESGASSEIGVSSESGASGESEASGESGPDNADSDEGVVRGFVAFDVRGDTVHVTDFDGSGSTIERLFEEPRRFARREEMGVEVVVPDDEATTEVLEASGFESAGRGPRFEGRRTTRYRIESGELEGQSDE